MAVPTIVTRTTKGSALSFAEADANFTNLRDATLTVTDGSNSTALNLNDTLTFTAGADISITESSGAVTIASTATAGIANVVEDTTPQLGGQLEANGNDINLAGNQLKDADLVDYKETINALGTTDSPTLTVSNGNVQSVTITSGLSLSAFSDAAAGQSITLLVSGSGTATGSATHKFAGGNTTLTTLSVVSIFYDGTNYLVSIATDFQ